MNLFDSLLKDIDPMCTQKWSKGSLSPNKLLLYTLELQKVIIIIHSIAITLPAW